MASSTKLPAPEASDPKEVAFALEEAIAHWAAGKKDDALQSLTRAADAAEHASLSDRARALHSAVTELDAPRAAGSGRPPPPSATRASAAPGRPAGTVSHAPPPPSARAAAASAASATASAPMPLAPNGVPLVPSTQVDRANGKHEGLHVWVRTSARDPTLLLVRLLPDGHAAPPGAYEAYLRPVEDGANLLTPKH